jgi:hypothetical protein
LRNFSNASINAVFANVVVSVVIVISPVRLSCLVFFSKTSDEPEA